MVKKRKAFVHVGLDDGSGAVIDAALERHAHALLELGVRRPAESAEELFRATLEMLGDHAAWGFERAEVEGAWTDIVRRGAKGRDTLVLSAPRLAAATPEQVALVLDALTGFQVHVVVTARAPGPWSVPGEAAHDLGVVLDRWGSALDHPERLHVVVGSDPAAVWKHLGAVVGFGTRSLHLDDVTVPATPRPPHLALTSRLAVLEQLGASWVDLVLAGGYDVAGDLADLVPAPDETTSADVAAEATEHALEDALQEIERLTRRNATLDSRLRKAEKKLAKKKVKLKRRLTTAA